MFNYLVDQAVFQRLLRCHEVIALGILLDGLQRLTGVLREDLVELLLGVQDVLGVDLDIGRLTLRAAGGWWIMMSALGRA